MELEQNLAKVQLHPEYNSIKLKALIGPHAGFAYSGPVSAWSYKYFEKLRDQKTRVFLLGPSHYAYLDGISLSGCD